MIGNIIRVGWWLLLYGGGAGEHLLAGDLAGKHFFTNPVVRQGADPWVIRWQTNYYFCQSHADGVWVNRAARLEDIGVDHWRCVWRPSAGTGRLKQVWAPELHFLQGRWFIYVAADDGDNANHRMYVLEGTTGDPQGPFKLKGKIAAAADRWAIDGTVLEMPGGKLYFIWAGWPGSNDGVQNLYLAPMSNPWTISGDAVCISQPVQKWEQRDYPHINEGPETLWHNGKLFIIYSASAFWDDHYCLGQLTWTGGEVLDPQSWVKQPAPVFARSAEVSGPGHCSFVQSPDGRQDWLIYHAHIVPGKPERDVRIQRFTWNPDGSPHFGNPVPPGVALPVPSGE